MRKSITPIIYSALLIVLTGTSVLTELIAREIGLLGEYMNVVDFPTSILLFISILVIGIPISWTTARFITRIEKLYKPTIQDHLRQSILYYFIIIPIITYWVGNGFVGDEGDGYLLIWLAISITANIVNYQYLSKARIQINSNTRGI